MTSNKRTWGLVLASSIILSGCAAMPGPYNGLGTDPMTMTVVVRNPLYGELTADQYQLTTRLANSCYQQGKPQLAGTLETVGTMGVVNGLTGTVSGAAITRFVPGSTVGVYAPYVGTLNAVAGGTAGLQVQSAAMSSFVGSCTNGFLQDDLAQGLAPGVHAYPALVRSNNRSGTTPSWLKQDPATPAATPASGN